MGAAAVNPSPPCEDRDDRPRAAYATATIETFLPLPPFVITCFNSSSRMADCRNQMGYDHCHGKQDRQDHPDGKRCKKSVLLQYFCPQYRYDLFHNFPPFIISGIPASFASPVCKQPCFFNSMSFP